MTETHHCRGVRCVPPLSSRCWAGHECKTPHTRVTTHIHSLLKSTSSYPPHHLTIPLIMQSWIRPHCACRAPKDIFKIICSFPRSASPSPQTLRAAETQQTANPSLAQTAQPRSVSFWPWGDQGLLSLWTPHFFCPSVQHESALKKSLLLTKKEELVMDVKSSISLGCCDRERGGSDLPGGRRSADCCVGFAWQGFSRGGLQGWLL